MQIILGPENAPESPVRGPRGPLDNISSREYLGNLAFDRACQQASDEVPLQGKEHDQRDDHGDKGTGC